MTSISPIHTSTRSSWLKLIEQLWNSSFIRYAISGVLTIVTDVLLLIVLKELFHIEVYLAATVSFCTSLVVNFLLNKYWSFNVRSYTSQQIVMYAILVAINYGAGIGLIAVATHTGASYVIGKLGALVLTTIWNYVLYKKVIFADKPLLNRHQATEGPTR